MTVCNLDTLATEIELAKEFDLKLRRGTEMQGTLTLATTAAYLTVQDETYEHNTSAQRGWRTNPLYKGTFENWDPDNH
eukprot:699030-Rhodomonas_salina.1